jgi:hypothetical protein
MSITGLLLFKNTKFIQAHGHGQPGAEGLFARIAEDNRHVSVSTIVTKNAQTRIFDPSAILFKTWPANSPAQDARIDMADVIALKTPDPVRKIIPNFDSPPRLIGRDPSTYFIRHDRIRSCFVLMPVGT